jgi:hypothetical protein
MLRVSYGVANNTVTGVLGRPTFQFINRSQRVPGTTVRRKNSQGQPGADQYFENRKHHRAPR